MSEVEGGLPRAGEIVPGGADRIGVRPVQPLPDATEELVELAIEGVLDQVPEIPETAPDGTATLQPWADTAAPPGRNKRPLSQFLEELRERVAAAPDARARVPGDRHPAMAYFDRFGPPRRAPGEGAGRRRSPRRRRRPHRGRSAPPGGTG